jgi:hypothetical protein
MDKLARKKPDQNLREGIISNFNAKETALQAILALGKMN